MTLTFLGTRGDIDIGTRRHRRHTSTLVSHRGAAVMIDCGADWLRYLDRVAPDAIVITHAHPDHVDGLRNGAPCPVYAPGPVWRRIGRWPVHVRHRLDARVPALVRGIRFEAVPIDHSGIEEWIAALGRARGVETAIARDGLRITVRARSASVVTRTCRRSPRASRTAYEPRE